VGVLVWVQHKLNSALHLCVVPIRHLEVAHEELFQIDSEDDFHQIELPSFVNLRVFLNVFYYFFKEPHVWIFRLMLLPRILKPWMEYWFRMLLEPLLKEDFRLAESNLLLHRNTFLFLRLLLLDQRLFLPGVDYLTWLAPLLSNFCFKCHSPTVVASACYFNLCSLMLSLNLEASFLYSALLLDRVEYFYAVVANCMFVIQLPEFQAASRTVYFKSLLLVHFEFALSNN
jgi:hypothetical protein